MHFIKKKTEEKRIEFDKKLKSKNILRIPGAYNPLTAKVKMMRKLKNLLYPNCLNLD